MRRQQRTQRPPREIIERTPRVGNGQYDWKEGDELPTTLVVDTTVFDQSLEEFQATLIENQEYRYKCSCLFVHLGPCK